MLDKLKEVVKKEEEEIIQFKLPRHIALVTKGKHIYSEKHKKPIEDVYNKSNLIILSTIKSAIKLKIPITTFYLLSTKPHELEHFSTVVESLTEFFKKWTRLIKYNAMTNQEFMGCPIANIGFQVDPDDLKLKKKFADIIDAGLTF